MRMLRPPASKPKPILLLKLTLPVRARAAASTAANARFHAAQRRAIMAMRQNSVPKRLRSRRASSEVPEQRSLARKTIVGSSTSSRWGDFAYGEGRRATAYPSDAPAQIAGGGERTPMRRRGHRRRCASSHRQAATKPTATASAKSRRRTCQLGVVADAHRRRRAMVLRLPRRRR